MENHHDDSSDNDKRMMNSFERYSDDKEEKKKKAKKKRHQQAEQEKRKNDERRDEEAKKDEGKRPSLLDALIKAEPVPAKKEASKKPLKNAEAEEKEASAETEQKSELSAEEQRAATEEYIAKRQEQLTTEETEQPEEAAAVQANRTFLQRLADRLRDSNASPDDELLQDVTDETVAELAAATDDEVVQQGAESAGEAPSSVEAGQHRYEDDYMVVIEQEDEEHSPHPAKPPVVPPPITPNIIDAATAAPYSQTAESQSGGGRSSGSDRLSHFGAKSERSPSASSEAPAGTTEMRTGKQRSGGEFLLGTFVGYLFGRRRGRINAESEHVPARKKLEQEVRQLQATIEQYEDKVRSAAAHRQEQRDVKPAVKEKFTPESFVPSVPRAEQNTEAPSTTAESGRASAEQAKTAEPIAPERIRTMPLTEVLREAERVDYRGTSLKGLYEQGFLNEARLRETMRLYAAGERYEQRLEQHIRAAAELAPRRSYEQERVLSQAAKHENDSAASASAAPVDKTETASQPSSPAAANEQLPPPTQQASGRGQPFDASAIKQASIGAAIGVVFVVVIIIALSLR